MVIAVLAIYFFPNLLFIQRITVFGYFLLAILNILFWVLAIYLASKLYKRVPNHFLGILGIFFIFFATEFLRASFPFGGFPWLAPFTQIVDVSVVNQLLSFLPYSVVSALIIVFPIILLELAQMTKKHSQKKGMTFALILLLLGFLSYTTKQIPETDTTFTVALVQPAVMDRSATGIQESISQIVNDPDISTSASLLVVPESGFNSSSSHLTIEETIPSSFQNVLINSTVKENGVKFNQNQLLQITGNTHQVTSRYNKQKLVPFGEYIPFRNILSKFFSQVGLLEEDYSAGTKPGYFEIDGIGISQLICFESIFEQDLNPATDLIIVSNNNHTYLGSSLIEGHVSFSQAQAIKFSIPVLHLSIDGPSYILYPNGARQQVASQEQIGLFEFTVSL